MENLVNPYPAKMEADLKLDEALAVINEQGQPGDIMPVDRSMLQQVLVLGIKWSRGTSEEQILARVAIPVMAAAASALDALLHTINAFRKAISVIPQAAMWAISFGNEKTNFSQELGEVLQHLAKAVGSIGMIAIAPLVASYDPEKALELSDKLMVTAGVTFLAEKMKIGPASLLEGCRIAQGAVRKIAFAVSEISLNIIWRPWRWVVTAAIDQVRAHPYVTLTMTLVGAYFGFQQAGYTEAIDQLIVFPIRDKAIATYDRVNRWTNSVLKWVRKSSKSDSETDSRPSNSGFIRC